jgi:hypothetical protein
MLSCQVANERIFDRDITHVSMKDSRFVFPPFIANVSGCDLMTEAEVKVDLAAGTYEVKKYDTRQYPFHDVVQRYDTRMCKCTTAEARHASLVRQEKNDDSDYEEEQQQTDDFEE